MLFRSIFAHISKIGIQTIGLRIMKKRLIPLLFLIIFCPFILNAQNDYTFNISHRLLLNDFGIKSSDATSKPSALPRGMELSFSKRLKEGMRLNVPLRAGFAKGASDTTALGRTFYGGDIQLQLEYAKYNLVPYCASGISLHKRMGKIDMGIPLCFGLNYRIEEGFSINAQTSYRLSFLTNNNSWHHGIGLVFNLGKIKPPKTPTPLPPYRSNTVVESLDIIGWWQIPFLHLPKSNDLLTPALKDYLVDTDRDSVPNIWDKCPDIAGLTRLNGCPEQPDLAWLSDSNTIAFEFGKSVLRQESFAFLDKISVWMIQHPLSILTIEGHTDNRGSAVLNQKLSEARAKVCYNYLITKGIEIRRLTFIGFGQNRPITSNTTELGRSQNRRAAFIMSNKP